MIKNVVAMMPRFGLLRALVAGDNYERMEQWLSYAVRFSLMPFGECFSAVRVCAETEPCGFMWLLCQPHHFCT